VKIYEVKVCEHVGLYQATENHHHPDISVDIQNITDAVRNWDTKLQGRHLDSGRQKVSAATSLAVRLGNSENHLVTGIDQGAQRRNG